LLAFLQQHALTVKDHYQADDESLKSKHSGKSTKNKIVLKFFNLIWLKPKFGFEIKGLVEGSITATNFS
jgi:hypothetical protein